MSTGKRRRQRQVRYFDPGVEPIGPMNHFRTSEPLKPKVPHVDADRRALAAAKEKRARKAARRLEGQS